MENQPEGYEKRGNIRNSPAWVADDLENGNRVVLSVGRLVKSETLKAKRMVHRDQGVSIFRWGGWSVDMDEA